MSTAVKEITPPVVSELSADSKVRTLARRCHEKSPGSIDAAVKMMRDKVETSPALFRELMTPLLNSAIRNEISSVARAERSAVWNHTPVAPRNRVADLAAFTARALMDFRLPNGIALRDAGKVDLTEAATFYQKQASDMAWKGRWLAAIAAKLSNAPVGETLSEDELSALQRDAAS